MDDLIFDPPVAAFLARLSGPLRRIKGTAAYSYEARKADEDLGLTRGNQYSLSALVHLVLEGSLPKDKKVYLHENGNDLDWRAQNLSRVSRADVARAALKPEFDPDAGITELPSGRFRARAYIPGAGLRAVGTFDTREQARAARLAAIAHPERFQQVAPQPEPIPEPYASMLAEKDARIAQLEAELAPAF